VRAIELLETYGVETPQGLVQPAKGLLTKTSVNRYLRAWGYDRATLARPPPAVRFEARHSHGSSAPPGGFQPETSKGVRNGPG
jgi:hypothetical protein